MSEAIIVIGLNWLGDVIMTLPALSAACASGREIHVVTRPHLAEAYILSGLPVVIHQVATNDNPLKVIKAMKPLTRIFANSAVTFPDSLRGGILANICATGNAIGFDTQFRGWFLNNKVKKPANYKSIHESKLHYMLMKEAIPDLPEEMPSLPNPSFSDEEYEKVASKFGIESKKEYILFAPGAAFGAAKRWPTEYFAQLAKLISTQYEDIQILITAGKNETKLSQEIADQSGVSLIDLAGKTNLEELAILLSRAKAMVANDSGTMHLAALYRTPTVVPVGPTDMVRTGALNENFTPVIATGCSKIPCRKRSCPLKTNACMRSLTPDMILSALKVYLN